MKGKAMKPYIKILIHSTGLYIVLPASLLFFKFVTIAPDVRGIIFILSIFAVILYFHFIATFFLPGVCAIYDLVTDNFVTKKLVHTNSFVDNSYYGLNERIKTDQGLMISEHILLKVFLLSTSGERINLLSAFNHRMEKQKSYIVTYGRYSKIIVSVLSQDNQELLDSASYYEAYESALKMKKAGNKRFYGSFQK